MRSRLAVALALALLMTCVPARISLAGEGTEASFRGTIESMPPEGLVGDWRVSGKTIHVTSSTTINQEHGRPVVGALVEGRGTPREDGSLSATAIYVISTPSVEVDFEGSIESLPAGGLVGDWRVGGKLVHVAAETRINQEHGLAVVGAQVEVHGLAQSDGSVKASQIEVLSSPGGGEEVEFRGTIESLPADGLVGDWRVGGKTVHVSSDTRINQEHGRAVVAAQVEVHGLAQSDGSVKAGGIEVLSSPDGGGFIEFQGVIESLPADGLVGDWRVGGKSVHVTAETRVDQEHGRAVVGALVEVKGRAQADGSVNAREVEVKTSPGGGEYVEFRGTIASLPADGLLGDWRVGERTVHVTASTRIDQEHGLAKVGALAEVRGWSRPDGSVNADRVEVRASESGGGDARMFGAVQQLPSGGLVGTWTVGGHPVQVTPSTTIMQERDTVAMGSYVEVEGWLQPDGSVTATQIEVKTLLDGNPGDALKFYGTIETLPAGGTGDWIIDGHTVHVTGDTSIKQKVRKAAPGVYVQVRGTLEADGSVAANKIIVKR